MKQNVNYLPQQKQDELIQIVNLIKEVTLPEMIILFGSYARNEWVEEKYDDEHYKYQSDFDILVIVATKSDAMQDRFESDMENDIGNAKDIETPVSIIVHDIDFVNRRLSKAQYFFSDIKKEGILLHDSGKFQLKEARELLPKERKKCAEEDFNYWFVNANEFLESSLFNFDKEYYSLAAFMLHQTTERLYSGILLVFTRYKPNTHDLAVLRKVANSVDNRLLPVLAFDTLENKRLFKLLRKAYVDARYKPSYVITKEELLKLYKQIAALKRIGELICLDKINSFT